MCAGSPKPRRARISATAPGRHVLGADTVVVLGRTVLGKPHDAADARRMLGLLSGRTHEVLTGVCLLSPKGGGDVRVEVRVAVTIVEVAVLSDAEIDWYVASGEPMDKAGAYAIQGLASRFITRIEGSYSNVVGLPVAHVYEMCRDGRIAAILTRDPDVSEVLTYESKSSQDRRHDPRARSRPSAYSCTRRWARSMQYYKYVDEVMAQPLASWQGKTLQVHGYVVPGTSHAQARTRSTTSSTLQRNGQGAHGVLHRHRARHVQGRSRSRASPAA